jgi:signal transduction histidine kinase
MFLSCNFGFSQQKVIDFLLNTDTIKDPKKALHQLDSVYNNVKLNPRTTIVLNHYRLKHYLTTNDFKHVSKISIESINLAKKHHLDSLSAYPYMMIGCSQYMNQKFDECIISFKKSLKLAEKYKNYKLIGNTCNNLGGILTDLGKFNEAEKVLLRAIETSKRTGEKRSEILSSRILATCYERQNLNEKALGIFEELLPKAYLLKDDYVLASVLVYYGQLLSKNGNPTLGLEKVREGIILLKRLGNKDSLATAFGQESKILHKLKRFEEESQALMEILKIRYAIFKEENQKQTNQFEILFKTKEIAQAKKIAEAKALAEQRKKNNYLLILLFVVIIAIGVFVIIYLRNARKATQIKLLFQEEKLASIIEGQENERTRIAKELHDGIVQDLTVLKMNLSEVNEKSELDSKLTKITKELRELSYQMMPISLKELGLIPALEDLFERSFTNNGITFDFEAFLSEERLDEKIEVNIYRICQELINNTLKHAKATEVNIVLRKKDKLLSLIFEDNGQGFDVSTAKSGIGLTSLKSRLEAIHGEIEYDSEINKGTTAFIKVNFE